MLSRQSNGSDLIAGIALTFLMVVLGVLGILKAIYIAFFNGVK